MRGRALNDRVLVQREAEARTETKSAGGLFIPQTAKERPAEGVVVSVGPNVKSDLKAGDRILFGKYSGSDIKIDDISYLILKDEEIAVLLEEEVLGATIPFMPGAADPFPQTTAQEGLL